MPILYATLIATLGTATVGLTAVETSLKDVLTPGQNWTLISVIAVSMVIVLFVLLPLLVRSLVKQAEKFAKTVQEINEASNKAQIKMAMEFRTALTTLTNQVNENFLEMARHCALNQQNK